jgi:hypothetical protein
MDGPRENKNRKRPCLYLVPNPKKKTIKKLLWMFRTLAGQGIKEDRISIVCWIYQKTDLRPRKLQARLTRLLLLGDFSVVDSIPLAHQDAPTSDTHSVMLVSGLEVLPKVIDSRWYK